MTVRRVGLPNVASKLRSAIDILGEEGAGPLVRRAVAYAKRTATRRYSALRFRPTAPESRVLEEDWDNLVILDACRYDQFERLSDLPGRLEARTSAGSCTPEFLAANFESGTHHDTVYVTANPMYRTGKFDGVFHEIVDVWDADWDEDNRTVAPAEMVAATLDAHERFPEKRIVAHFVQPHYPFIGERGRALESEVDEGLSGVEWISEQATDETAIDDRRTPWDLLADGVLDEAAVRAAYDENLTLALAHVETLLDGLPEKTVVTSDHGNLIGESVVPFGGPVYGHPPNTYAEGLLTVPWLVVGGTERKRIRSAAPERTTSAEEDVVADRLADLGYVEP